MYLIIYGHFKGNCIELVYKSGGKPSLLITEEIVTIYFPFSLIYHLYQIIDYLMQKELFIKHLSNLFK